MLLHCSLVLSLLISYSLLQQSFHLLFPARKHCKLRGVISASTVILHQERATAADLLRTEDNQHPSAVFPPKPSSLRAQHVQAPTVNQESLGDTRDCWAFAVISCRRPSAICSRCCTELLPKPQSPSHSAPSGHRNQLQVSKEKEPAVFQQLNRTCPSVDSKTEHSFHVL